MQEIQHPKHYNKGKIEVWDFIADQELNFDLGSAVKYICRAGDKEGNSEETDIKKAIEFLNHHLKVTEEKSSTVPYITPSITLGKIGEVKV